MSMSAQILTVVPGGTPGGADLILVEAHIVSDTLVETESGTLHTNEGAAGVLTLTLPPALAGLWFLFACQDGSGNLIVKAVDDDTIRIGGLETAAAGAVHSTNVGDFLAIVCLNGVEWVAMNVIGIWVDD